MNETTTKTMIEKTIAVNLMLSLYFFIMQLNFRTNPSKLLIINQVPLANDGGGLRNY